MVFRLRLRMELERPSGEMTAAVPVDVSVVYERGQWRAQCSEPPAVTLNCDSLEEALVSVAREVSSDWSRERAGSH